MLLEAAIAALSQEIISEPNNATLYKERGRLRHQLGDEAGAIQDLRKAIELCPAITNEFANGCFKSKRASSH